MEIKKVSSNPLSKDAVVTDKNMKLECVGDECYLVDIPESKDEDTTLVLENPENTKAETEPKASTISETKSTETGKKSKKTTVVKLTTSNFNKETRNQEGTTFVIVGGPACGRCKLFAPIVKKVNEELGDKAKFTSFTLSDNKDLTLFRKLKEETKNNSKSLGYPIVIKMVNGKATELYSYSDYSNKYTNEKKMISWFKNKIEKTDKKSSTEEKKSSNEIATLTADNYEEQTKKGVTFIIGGTSGCGRCKQFKAIEKQLNEKYGDDATFADLNLASDSKEYQLFKKLKAEAGVKTPCGYPVIIKCVDGKVEGIYDYNNISKIYTDIDKMSEWIEGKLEGTTTEDIESQPTENTDECTDGSCTEPSATEETTKSKYNQSLINQDTETIEQAKNSMIIQVQSTKSIGELKNLLLDLSNTAFDINTQLALMDVLNEIKRTDELNSAKATVLNKIRSI